MPNYYPRNFSSRGIAIFCSACWLVIVSSKFPMADTAGNHFNKGYAFYQKWVQNREDSLLKQAISEMEISQKKSPKNPALLEWVGYLHILRNEYSLALHPLLETIPLLTDYKAPDKRTLEILSRVNLGYAYSSLHRYSEAADYLQQASSLTELPDLLYRIDFDLGSASLKAAQLNPADKPLMLQQAITAFRGALAVYAKSKDRIERPSPVMQIPYPVTEQSPAQLQEGLGSALQQSGDFTGAGAAYTQAVQLDPKNPLSWHDLGMLNRTISEKSQSEPEHRDSLNRAKAALEKANQLAPNDYQNGEDLAETLLELGAYKQASIQFDDAATARRNAGVEEKTPAKVLYNQALADSLAGRSDSAIRLTTRLLKTDSHNPKLLNLLGLLYIHQKRYDQAITPLQEAISISPDDLSAIQNLGVDQMDLRRFSDAVQTFQQLKHGNPANPEYSYLLGSAQAQSGDYPSAAASFNEYAKLDPAGKAVPNGMGYQGLAYSLQQTGDLSGAAVAYKKVTVIDPGNQTAWVNLGLALKLMAEKETQPDAAMESAHQAFSQAILLKPMDSLALYSDAETLIALNEKAQAVSELQTAVIHSKTPYNSLMLLGQTYTSILRDTEAISAYKQALSANPGDITAERMLGQTQFLNRQYAEAETSFQSVLTQDPQDLQAAMFLARSQVHLSRFADARKTLSAAMKLNHPGRLMAQAMDNLASLFYMQGDKSSLIQARELFLSSLKQYPDSPDGYIGLGLISLKLGAPQHAISLFKQALHLNPGSSEAANDLGTAYEQIGDLPHAYLAYRMSIKSDPHNSKAKQNIARFAGWLRLQRKGGK